MIDLLNNALLYRFGGESLRIEPWGDNAVRVRAWKQVQMPAEDWALTEPHSAEAQIRETETGYSLTNGKLTVHLIDLPADILKI